MDTGTQAADAALETCLSISAGLRGTEAERLREDLVRESKALCGQLLSLSLALSRH